MTGPAAASPGDLLRGPQGVNLLPGSVTAARELRRLRGWLALVLVGVALLVVVLLGVLLVAESRAERDADRARTETDRLSAEVARYAEAAEVRAAIGRTTDARQLAMGTEIRWVDMIRRIEAVAPAGTAITSFSAQAASPADGSSFTAPDPLAHPGVATITFSIQTPTLPDTAAWLDALNGIPGFMDASFTTASLTDGEPEDGVGELYTVASTVQVNVRALSGAHVELGTPGGGERS